MAVQTRRGNDPSPRGTSKAKFWGIAVGAVAALTTTAMIVTLATGDDSAPTHVASPQATPEPKPGKARGQVTSGVPVGYPRTEAGAKAAAANYTVISGSSAFLTSKDARHRAVSVMSAGNRTSTAMKEADHEARRARAELKGDKSKLAPRHVIARTGILSAHTLGADIHKATVRLWTTTARGSATGHATPKAAFRSVTVSLVWERNDWKMSGSSSSSGLVAPVDTRQATNVTSDFADYVPARASDPVLSGAETKDGLPGAYERTERGAHAAATSAVMLRGDPRFFSDAEWRNKMLTATTASSVLGTAKADADSMTQLVVENRSLGDDGKTADGGLLVTRTAVLGSRAVAYSGQTASMELWTASVGGVAGKNESERPQIGFIRMTVDLIWADGTWKTTAVTPSEPLVPSPPAAEEAAPASSFADVGGVSDAPSLA
ncbi:hypothetical protein [Streptomyces kanamyceticus]|uniref:Putative integral membrane protein n=1 Tax=Streptomyces kanamyceticus TaxID=1967 RepID=Q1EQQ1_STRKN|nr:hypothetical protein [Streptomyces kanamyceticus]BAE95469.1 putative integral membrane protein [Streptomyces kanamyceticus]